MDRDRAVRTFLERLDSLRGLPLVTDAEMAGLFGGEVAAALAELDAVNRAGGICRRCREHCCRLVRCELYSPRFSNCPLYELRPVVCRLHFCHRFPGATASLMEDLSSIFFEAVLAAGRAGSPAAALFDCPPLGRVAPRLVAGAAPWMAGVRDGTVPPHRAEAAIREMAFAFHAAAGCVA